MGLLVILCVWQLEYDVTFRSSLTTFGVACKAREERGRRVAPAQSMEGVSVWDGYMGRAVHGSRASLIGHCALRISFHPAHGFRAWRSSIADTCCS